MELKTIGELIIGGIGVFFIIIGIGGVLWEMENPSMYRSGPSAFVFVILGLLLIGVVFIVHGRKR